MLSRTLTRANLVLAAHWSPFNIYALLEFSRGRRLQEILISTLTFLLLKSYYWHNQTIIDLGWIITRLLKKPIFQRIFNEVMNTFLLWKNIQTTTKLPTLNSLGKNTHTAVISLIL